MSEAISTSVVTTSAPPAAPVSEAPPTVPEKFLRDGKPDYAALTKAYVELEKSRGQPAASGEAANANPSAAAPPTPTTPPAIPSGFEPFEKEFQSAGKLSDASYKSLSDRTGMSKSDIDAYISFRQGQANAATQDLLTAVGGQEAWAKVSQWASTSLKPEEIAGINTILADGSKNPQTAKLALEGLKARFEAARGKEPNLVEGGSSSDSPAGFATIKEATKALRDPRYKSSKEYRAQVDAKITSSKLFH